MLKRPTWKKPALKGPALNWGVQIILSDRHAAHDTPMDNFFDVKVPMAEHLVPLYSAAL
jgi:hypothetical protein